eukprot:1111814-Rhodomonas_salina.2
MDLVTSSLTIRRTSAPESVGFSAIFSSTRATNFFSSSCSGTGTSGTNAVLQLGHFGQSTLTGFSQFSQSCHSDEAAASSSSSLRLISSNCSNRRVCSCSCSRSASIAAFQIYQAQPIQSIVAASVHTLLRADTGKRLVDSEGPAVLECDATNGRLCKPIIGLAWYFSTANCSNTVPVAVPAHFSGTQE